MENTSRVITFLKHPLTMLVIAVILICSMLGYYFYSFQASPPPSDLQQPTIVLSPTVEPTAELDTFPTPFFTNEETKYPQVIPQVFPESDETHSGSLVIISNPAQVSVILTASDDEGDYEVIKNNTPFKASGIPAGDYKITAIAPGYEQVALPVQIYEAEVNRIRLVLKPLSN